MPLTGGLPLPWENGSPDVQLASLLSQLQAMAGENASARDLAQTLAYAEARVQGLGSAMGDAPPHVRLAQTVLEIAVEWRMPTIERWATAWLSASGLPHLQLRWSSRSRDGRARLDGWASGEVRALCGAGEGVRLGTSTGRVESWAPDGGTVRMGELGQPVWAVAANGEWTFAGGANAFFLGQGPGGGAPWPPLPHTAGISAASVTDSGLVVCGDENGEVKICEPQGAWRELPVRERSRVAAVAVAENWIGVVWQSGRVAICGRRAGEWRVDENHALGGRVGSAAWAADGRLAFTLGGATEVSVLSEGTVRIAWRHQGVRLLAWSPGGWLASAGATQKIRIAPPLPDADPEELGADSRITAMAMVADRTLVTAHGRELVRWDLARYGSEDPTIEPDDEITAVAVAPENRGRTALGTRFGRLWEHDGRGIATQWDPPLVKGTIHQLVGYRHGWLVASQRGAYWWNPAEGGPRQLSNRLCLAVAVWRGRPVYAAAGDLMLGKDVASDEPGQSLFRCDVPIRDIAVGADGSLAVLDRQGTVHHIGRDNRIWRAERVGDQLLACRPDGLLVLTHDDAVVSHISLKGSRTHARLRPGARSVAATADGEFVAVYPQGGVVVFAPTPTGASTGTVIAEAPGRFTRVASANGRTVAAGRRRMTGYDLGGLAGDGGELGSVRLSVHQAADGCRIRLPGGGETAFADSELALFEERARSSGVDALSRAVHQGGRLGDQLWFAGLDREIDKARGADPHRPVRLDWHLEASDPADRPWELLHPATSPLCWFDTPPVTMARVVAPHPIDRGAQQPTGRPRLLVVRTNDMVLAGVDDAYDRMRRRTRRNNVRLVTGLPVVINTEKDFDQAFAPTDILHLWAHSGTTAVRLPSGARTTVPVAEMAVRISATGARLVVLVGCKSANLARELVQHGVEAVVGMRTAVYSHTVQPLVEELTARVLDGSSVDLALVEALRQYVLTGQPGAAAIPLLYLRAGSTGELFPRPPSTPHNTPRR